MEMEALKGHLWGRVVGNCGARSGCTPAAWGRQGCCASLLGACCVPSGHFGELQVNDTSSPRARQEPAQRNEGAAHIATNDTTTGTDDPSGSPVAVRSSSLSRWITPRTGQSLTRVILLQLLDPLSHHSGHGTSSPWSAPTVSRPFLTTLSQILTGVLRHYATILMATAPKKLDQKTLREQRSLLHGIAVRSNFHTLSKPSFVARREALTAAYESGAYLKAPENRGQAPPNPMSDPSSMEGMMGMMKSQMAMIIPNTLIMSWINAFFSGYVISTSRCVCLSARPRADR
jgi:hypothetical protein